MASRLTFDMSMSTSTRDKPTRREPSDAVRVLVVSDLSGDRPRDAKAAPLASARIVDISVDNFDDVMRRIQPQAALEGGDVTFESVADFHPDRLYDSLEVIAQLRRTRARVADPNTFAAERDRLLVASPGAAKADAAEDNASTLQRLLGVRPVGEVAPTPTPGGRSPALDRMLREIIAPYIKPDLAAEQDRALASVDAAIGDAMRKTLHTPAFQAVEAAWRGLHWLVCQNDLGDQLKVSVLDVSRDELLADLRACQGELERSMLYRLVVQQRVAGPGGQPLALVVADFSCSGSEDDISLFAGLGAVAANAGGCLLAAADPSLVGCDDLARKPERGYWSAPDAAMAARVNLLRESTVAPFIGLCMPRVLGRAPYGEQSDPIERFEFTELTPDPAHETFLWLNPAFACAQLIVAAYAEHGWEARLAQSLELGDLPLAIYRANDGDAVKPCAEVFLDYASAERVLSHGVMPFMSHRDRNAVQLMRLQSIAAVPTPLAGPWR